MIEINDEELLSNREILPLRNRTPAQDALWYGRRLFDGLGGLSPRCGSSRVAPTDYTPDGIGVGTSCADCDYDSDIDSALVQERKP